MKTETRNNELVKKFANACGKDVSELSDANVNGYRKRSIGDVYHLTGEFDVASYKGRNYYVAETLEGTQLSLRKILGIGSRTRQLQSTGTAECQFRKSETSKTVQSRPETATVEDRLGEAFVSPVDDLHDFAAMCNRGEILTKGTVITYLGDGLDVYEAPATSLPSFSDHWRKGDQRVNVINCWRVDTPEDAALAV